MRHLTPAHLTERTCVLDRHWARYRPRLGARKITRASPSAVQVRDLNRHLHGRPNAYERTTHHPVSRVYKRLSSACVRQSEFYHGVVMFCVIVD